VADLRDELINRGTRQRFLVEQLCGKTLDRVPVFWLSEKLARALAGGRNITILNIVSCREVFDLHAVSVIVGAAKPDGLRHAPAQQTVILSSTELRMSPLVISQCKLTALATLALPLPSAVMAAPPQSNFNILPQIAWPLS
jgi:hypothetical protein